jgi:hypothetical protein
MANVSIPKPVRPSKEAVGEGAASLNPRRTGDLALFDATMAMLASAYRLVAREYSGLSETLRSNPVDRRLVLMLEEQSRRSAVMAVIAEVALLFRKGGIPDADSQE